MALISRSHVPPSLPAPWLWSLAVQTSGGSAGSPAAVTALPESGLALRARRTMLPGQIASAVRCVFTSVHCLCCPDHPTSPCMGRKGQRSLGDSSVLAFRGGRAGSQGQDRDTYDQDSGSGMCCICQPLSSKPDPLKEEEHSSSVFFMYCQITRVQSLLPQQLGHIAIESVCVSGSAVLGLIYRLSQLVIPWRRRT